MNRQIAVILGELINEKENQYALQIMRHDSSKKTVPIHRNMEYFHLFLTLRNELVPPLALQFSISLVADEYVRCLIFPSPLIISNETIHHFITFTNTCNRYVLTGKGRFWVDVEHLDFAYEILLPFDDIINKQAETGEQLFDKPLTHFQDMMKPLYMLQTKQWQADIATNYLDELRIYGVVNNDD